MKKNIKLSIADYITLSNGILGFLAITYIIDTRYLAASIFIIVCILVDGLDGYVARRLKVEHTLGSYLDLISDTISFSFAPAILTYSVYYDSTLGRSWESPVNAMATFVPTVIVFFGVLRLSRFADKNNQKKSYKGIPTPLLAFFIINLTYIFGWGGGLSSRPYIVLPTILLISFFLYTDLSYPKIRKSDEILTALIFLIISLLGLLLTDNTTLKNIFIGISICACLLYISIGPIMVSKYVKKSTRESR